MVACLSGMGAGLIPSLGQKEGREGEGNGGPHHIQKPRKPFLMRLGKPAAWAPILQVSVMCREILEGLAFRVESPDW